MTSPGPLYRNVYRGRCVKWADVERFAPIMLGPLLSMTLYSKDICLGGLRRTLMDSKKKLSRRLGNTMRDMPHGGGDMTIAVIAHGP
jgi:hypothetical protein